MSERRDEFDGDEAERVRQDLPKPNRVAKTERPAKLHDATQAIGSTAEWVAEPAALRPPEIDLVSKADIDQTLQVTQRIGPVTETTAGAGAPPANSESTSVEVGRDFGKYHILSLLGRGGMGAVYLARDEQLGRQVALKIPRIERGDSQDIRDRFLREAKAAATLHHPNLCPVFEFGEIGGQLYLAMAFIEGSPLTRYVTRGKPVPERQALLLVRKLALALQEAHEQGLVHRDLKPGNIMIDRRKEPIIMDFGLARRDQHDDTRLTQTGMFLGTPAYSSPEQIRNRPGTVGVQTDVYSLGVILFELLTGQLPFEASGMMALLTQVLTEEPRRVRELNGKVSLEVEQICVRAMHRSLDQRYASMAEFAKAITDQLKGKKAKATDKSIVKAEAAESDDGSLEAMLTEFSQTAGGDSRAGLTEAKLDFLQTAMISPDARSVLAARGLTDRLPWWKKPLTWILAASITTTVLLLGGLILLLRGASVAEEGAVRILVPDAPEQLELRIDQRLVANSPSDQPFVLPPGVHTVELKAKGFRAEIRKVTIAAGQTEVVKISLVPDDAIAMTNLHEQELESAGKANSTDGNSSTESSGELPNSSEGTGIEDDSPKLGDSGTEEPPKTEGEKETPGGDGMGEQVVVVPNPVDPKTEQGTTDLGADSLVSPDSRVPFVNDLRMTLLPIPAGQFRMGSSELDNERPEHDVSITRPFYLSQTEVTQTQYQRVMKRDPSQMKGGQSPVDHVTWDEALEFCRKLSALPTEKAAGRVYRLPTEAEWEYACRAGSATPYSFGDDPSQMSEHGWTSESSVKRTQPVGKKAPNAWGLMDMHGNVREWCADWIGPYSVPAEPDPQGPAVGFGRVLRGGSYLTAADEARCAARTAAWIGNLPPEDAGFRVVCELFDVAVLRAKEEATEEAIRNQEYSRLDPHEMLSLEPTVNSLGMKLKLIPAGSFILLTAESKVDFARPPGPDQYYAPKVERPFFIGTHEVTLAQWAAVMPLNPELKLPGDTAVGGCTWHEAIEFCRRLSELPEERRAGRVYRLPTKFEWIHACRAGTTTLYSFGDDPLMLPQYAWFQRNAQGVNRVGLLRPNPWGLFDMHGNALEWTADHFQELGLAGPTSTPANLQIRVVQGGHWKAAAENCVSNATSIEVPELSTVGLRIVVDVVK